jgi:hypothetical protein
MNRFLYSMLLSFGFLLHFPEISLAKKEELKLRLYKGAHHVYTISQENKALLPDNTLQVEQRTSLTIDHQVLEQLSNGNFKIEISYKRFSTYMKYNQKEIKYDTNVADESNPFYQTFQFMTDIRLNYEVSKEGVVSNITGFEPIRKREETDPQLASFLRIFGKEMFITELYNYIPAKNVEIGNNWKTDGILPDLMDFKYDIQFTLKEFTPQNLKISQAAEIKMMKDLPAESDGSITQISESGTQKGLLVLDPKTNMRLSSSVTLTAELVVTTTNSKTQDKKVNPLKIISQFNISLNTK